MVKVDGLSQDSTRLLVSTTTPNLLTDDAVTTQPLRDDDPESSSTPIARRDDNLSNSLPISGRGRYRNPQTRRLRSTSRRVLFFLFSMNGFTLALPTTALMYIVNTRVALSAALLPIYASIAFLPFGLKPIYAMVASIPFFRKNRYVLISCFLLVHGLACIATTFVTSAGNTQDQAYKTAVISVFAVAFLRGVGSAFAEFVVGLILVDQVMTSSTNRNASSDTSLGSSTTVGAANELQSLAATARHVGSLVAHTGATIYLSFSTRMTTTGSLGDYSANVLLFVTSLFSSMAAVVAWVSRIGHVDSYVALSAEALPDSALTTDTASSDNYDHINRAELIDQCVPYNVQEVLSNSDGSCSSGSYQSIQRAEDVENLHQGNDEVGIFLEIEDRDISQPVESSASARDGASEEGGVYAVILVVSLQVTLILLMTRSPIIDATSTGTWVFLFLSVLTVTIFIILATYRSWKICTNTGVMRSMLWHIYSHPSYRVAAFLLIRNSLPNSSYLMESYVYSLFEERPAIIQGFSVAGMGVAVIASWSYGCFFRKYFGSDRECHRSGVLVKVIVATTVLASFASLGYVVIVDTVSKWKGLVIRQAVATLVVQTVSAVFSTWKFIPDVVLATVTAVDDGDHASAIQYGSLLACIDFGGQLGSTLTAPLIQWLKISREDWSNLGLFVTISALLGLLPLTMVGGLSGRR